MVHRNHLHRQFVRKRKIDEIFVKSHRHTQRNLQMKSFKQEMTLQYCSLNSPPDIGPVQNLASSIMFGSRFNAAIASLHTLLVTVESRTFCKIFTGPLPMPLELAPHPAKVPGPLGIEFGGGIRIGRMRELKVRGDANRASPMSFGPLLVPLVHPGWISQRVRSTSIRTSLASTSAKLCFPATATMLPRLDAASVKHWAD